MERPQDLGGDRGDDRQSVAQAAVALKLDAAKWRKRRGMKRLLDGARRRRGLTRYVGGAVRDDLLGLPVSDIDLATRLAPDEVIRRLEEARIKAVPTGIDHGTITAVSDGHPFEVTTLRRDVSTDGRRATVAFTDDWQEDAARRDFTINALSADPETRRGVRLFRRPRRPRAAPRPLHRRSASAHRRGSSADPALLPLPRPLRRRRAGRRRARRLRRARQRSDGAVARADRRRAAEAARGSPTPRRPSG